MDPETLKADRPLFTPGPLTTSNTVKGAMLRDLGSRDPEFIEKVQQIRTQLLHIAGTEQKLGYEAVLMQGSGTFGLESVISSAVAPDETLFVVANGAYGHRLAEIARIHDIETEVLVWPENESPEPRVVEDALRAASNSSMLAMVHCETSTGMVNPVQNIAQVARDRGVRFLVDSMSAFGAVPIPVADWGVDFLISSSNKCIEGVPGFSFAVCRRQSLNACQGNARTLSLDLFAQWQGLETNGQFRFTPPTHAVLAFEQALEELEQEGGVSGRGARYAQNYQCLVRGMRAMGFEEYLSPADQGFIITAFHDPSDPRYEFSQFYRRLHDKGFVIYPGKLADAACFRIGSIGRLFRSDMERLLHAIQEVVAEMGIENLGPGPARP